LDYKKEYNVGRADIAKWIEQNAVKRQFHILEGFESCTKALPLLFNGGNTGKLYDAIS
jgi:NADPH-dependent curcumin reductase CurA